MADKYITGLYQALEQDIIADIARRIRKTGRYTETAEIMVKSMTEQGYSADKIRTEVMKLMRADADYQKFVAENTKEYKAYIQSEIDATLEKAEKAGIMLAEEAGNMAFNNDLSMWKQAGADLKKPNTMSQLMVAFRAQTINELKNLTRTTGFRNTPFSSTSIEHIYQKELDLALIKVASGGFSYDQAVNDSIHRLAQSGLRSIDYANGRSYQLDTAARMSVRTGISQLSGRITEANILSTGVDLVITSQHMGARDEHVPWQNKVFSYSGKSKKYPDFRKETGYGTPGGIKGVNCTHDFYPFWEGRSIIPEDIKEPAPVTVNGKEYTYYQATQQQRKMERDIRATKREIEAQKAIGGDTKELNALLKKQRHDYMMFSNDVGIRPKENRLRVVSGSSNLEKKNKTKMSKAGRKVTEFKPANSIQEVNENATNVLLKSYDDRRKHFDLNMSTADELRNMEHNPFTANYQGISLESANAFNRVITKLSEEYYTGFTKIEVGDPKKFFGVSEFASTQHLNSIGQKTLVINPIKTKDYDKLVERIQELSKKGYSVDILDGKADEYIATHEFAHSLFDLSGSYKNFVGMDVKQMKQIKKELDAIYTDYMNEVKVLEDAYKRLEQKFIFAIDMDEMEELRTQVTQAKQALDKVKISRYSLQSADEFMAEAFTDVKIGKEASAYSRKAVGILDKYFKKNLSLH